MILGLQSRRKFADLTEQEVLALAIASEEDDATIFRTYAAKLRADGGQAVQTGLQIDKAKPFKLPVSSPDCRQAKHIRRTQQRVKQFC